MGKMKEYYHEEINNQEDDFDLDAQYAEILGQEEFQYDSRFEDYKFMCPHCNEVHTGMELIDYNSLSEEVEVKDLPY